MQQFGCRQSVSLHPLACDTLVKDAPCFCRRSNSCCCSSQGNTGGLELVRETIRQINIKTIGVNSVRVFVSFILQAWQPWHFRSCTLNHLLAHTRLHATLNHVSVLRNAVDM